VEPAEPRRAMLSTIGGHGLCRPVKAIDPPARPAWPVEVRQRRRQSGLHFLQCMFAGCQFPAGL